MLTLSTKSRYGLKAVLALAENEGRGLLQIREIARLKNIPRHYLEQIFNQLGKAGIIRSVRGKNGG
ncbi:MAG: Rrf2 family transcriptional regulator, partial [Desulfurivibrionaceae bacterium]